MQYVTGTLISSRWCHDILYLLSGLWKEEAHWENFGYHWVVRSLWNWIHYLQLFAIFNVPSSREYISLCLVLSIIPFLSFDCWLDTSEVEWQWTLQKDIMRVLKSNTNIPFVKTWSGIWIRISRSVWHWIKQIDISLDCSSLCLYELIP